MVGATHRTLVSANWTKIGAAGGREAMALIDATGNVEVAVADGEQPRPGLAAGHKLFGQMSLPVKGAEIVWARGAGVYVCLTMLKRMGDAEIDDSKEAMQAARVADTKATDAKRALSAPYQPFANRAAAEAATIPADVSQINVAGLQYALDPTGTALTTADGKKWSPLGAAYPEHFGAVGDGVADDTVAVQAWAANAGQISASGSYLLSAAVDVFADRINATGARFVFSGTGYPKLFTLQTENSRWTGGRIDGGLLASVGIYSKVGGTVKKVRIHRLRHNAGQVAGIRFVGPKGGIACDNEIEDISAVGDGNVGDGFGPSRAILGSSTTALTAPFEFCRNRIRNVAGEEGDAIQILVFDGTYPFLSAAWSIVRGNDLRGFNRRGIKIQASNVIVEDNIALAPGAASGIGVASVIEGIACNNVIIRRNITEAAAGMRGVYVTQSASPSKLTGIIIQGNIHNGVPDADGFVASGVTQSVVSENIQLTGRRAFYALSTEQSVIRNNVAMNSVSDGSYTDFEFGATNDRILSDGNVATGGTKYGAVGARAPSSMFLGSVSLRPTGAGVVAASTAVGSIIADTYVSTTSGVAVASVTESATAVTRTQQLGTAGGAQACNDIWVSGDPATTRVGRFHNRGTIAWNGGTGTETGWRCTVTGIPGTWAAF